MGRVDAGELARCGGERDADHGRDESLRVYAEGVCDHGRLAVCSVLNTALQVNGAT